MREISSDKNKMGLVSSVLFVVGYVVGASIYILPSKLANDAGPGVLLSFLIAGVLGALSCVVAARVSVLFPRSGANLYLISKVFPKSLSFLSVWTIIATIIVGVPLLSYGFAEYLSYFVPSLSLGGTALLVTLAIVAINIVGLRLSMSVQALAVGVFLASLLVMMVMGLPQIKEDVIAPFAPKGLSPILISAIPAYFSYTGFLALTELGGQIKNPQRTIPRALAIAYVIILVVYLCNVAVVVGVIPAEQLASHPAPFVAVAKTFLPDGLASAVGLSALLASWTSINGVLLAQARDIIEAADEGLLPSFLSSARNANAERNAAIFVGGIALLGCLLGSSVKEFAIVTVIGFMVYQILIGLALLRFDFGANPVAVEGVKRGGALLRFSIYGLIGVSALFMIAGMTTSINSVLSYLVFVALGYGVFFWCERSQRLVSGRADYI